MASSSDSSNIDQGAERRDDNITEVVSLVKAIKSKYCTPSEPYHGLAVLGSKETVIVAPKVSGEIFCKHGHCAAPPLHTFC